MKPRFLVVTLLYVLAVMCCATACALDEAVLTQTPKLEAAMKEKEKADAEKAFNAAMSVWYKHHYNNGEKLLGQFARV